MSKKEHSTMKVRNMHVFLCCLETRKHFQSGVLSSAEAHVMISNNYHFEVTIQIQVQMNKRMALRSRVSQRPGMFSYNINCESSFCVI